MSAHSEAIKWILSNKTVCMCSLSCTVCEQCELCGKLHVHGTRHKHRIVFICTSIFPSFDVNCSDVSVCIWLLCQCQNCKMFVCASASVYISIFMCKCVCICDTFQQWCFNQFYGLNNLWKLIHLTWSHIYHPARLFRDLNFSIDDKNFFNKFSIVGFRSKNIDSV